MIVLQNGGVGAYISEVGMTYYRNDYLGGRKRMKKVIIGRNKGLMVLILTLCMMTALTGLCFAQFSDIQGQWASEQITDWVNQGLAKGYEDGTFKPDHQVSRAEFMTLVNRSFGFTASDQVDFQDVLPADWFYEEVAKAKIAGYISGYEDGTVKPNGPISRQEAASIIARILNLDTAANTTSANQFKDAGDIPQWSKGYISAVVTSEVMKGYPDQTYQPAKTITRAEAIVTLDRALNVNIETTSYDQAGTFGPKTGLETIEGNVKINVADVVLQNFKITGNLFLTAGIGEGEVTLNNVSVLGNTVINGGGSHSVILKDCVLPTITVSKEGVRVVASGNTSARVVRLDSGATLVEVSVTGPGFETVTVSEVIPADANVTLSGQFDGVNIDAKNVDVEVADGSIDQLNVTEKATGANVNLTSSAKVNTLSLNAAVSLTGKGTIDIAEINVSGATIEQEPNNIEKASGVSYEIGVSSSKDSSGGSNGSSTEANSGGGDGNNPLNLVDAYLTTIRDDSSSTGDSLNDNDSVPVDSDFKIVFDRGVIRDYWDNNKDCITLQTSSGTDVPITISRILNDDGTPVEDEKRTIFISPDNSLSKGKDYQIIIDAALSANNGNTLGREIVVSFSTEAPPTSSGGSGSEPAIPAAPVLTDTEVTSKGDVSLTFNKEIADPTGTQGQFTVMVAGAADVVTGVEATSTTGKIKLVLTTKVTGGQAVTVAYTKSDEASKQVKASDGGILETFDATAVTNELIPAVPAAPIVASTEVTSKGDVSITFDKAMADPAGTQEQFTVMVAGAADVVTGVEATSTTGKIKLVLTTKVTSGQAVTVAYTKSDEASKQVKASDGGILETFDATAVTNELLPAVPAAPVLTDTEVTSKGDVSITFNKEIADPTGTQEQFTVMVAEAADVVTSVVTTSTTGKIKLVLTTKVTGGQAVTVAYMKSDDLSKQVKASDGGILETFGAKEVTNGI